MVMTFAEIEQSLDSLSADEQQQLLDELNRRVRVRRAKRDTAEIEKEISERGSLTHSDPDAQMRYSWLMEGRV